jgi:hypothetical protein
MAESEEQGETQSAESRYWLTNDGLAYVLNITLFLVLVVSMAGYTVQVPDLLIQIYGFSVALANTWAFGSGAATKLGEMIRG